MSATQGVSSGSEFDSFIDEREKKKYYASNQRICKNKNEKLANEKRGYE